MEDFKRLIIAFACLCLFPLVVVVALDCMKAVSRRKLLLDMRWVSNYDGHSRVGKLLRVKGVVDFVVIVRWVWLENAACAGFYAKMFLCWD